MLHKIFSFLRPTRLLLFLFAALAPAFALAAGSEAKVELSFTNSDRWLLGASALLAIIAIVVGFMIRSWVLQQSDGNDKIILFFL